MIFFPDWFSPDLNYLEKYKQLLKAHIDAVLGDEKAYKVVERLSKHFWELQRPLNFNPFEKDNAIVKHEKSFEEILAAMEESGATDARKMTEFSFYCRMQYLEKKVKKLEQYGAGKQ
jgi:hypothetical protein